MSLDADKGEYLSQPLTSSDDDETNVPDRYASGKDADPWTAGLIRGGFAAIFAYDLIHLVIGIFLAPYPPARLVALHIAVMASALGSIWLTWTSWYRLYWRELVFAECTAMAISAVALGAMLGSPVQFYSAAVMLQLGTAAIVPWGVGWQTAYAAICALAAILASSVIPMSDPYLVYRWLELGTASGLALFVAALSERHRYELRERITTLQASEEKLWKIFDANPDVITIATYPDGRHLHVSNRFLKTGYSRGEVIGATARQLNLWADEARLLEYENRLKATGYVHNMEAAFRLKDGTILPCLISGSVVQLSRGPCVVSVVRDISRMKQTERELIAARTAAEAASRAKSEFLSSMSHEIRTPMNAILGMAEVLADSDLSAEQRKYLSIMMNNGNALLDLIDDILDLARIESGKLSLERTAFDVHDLAERVAETLSIRAHQKRLELTVRIAAGVVPGLVGDPLRLRQVLMNLISNAIKFTERGEVTLDIERGLEPDVLHFMVADTGIGIAPDQCDRIFASYAQADHSTARKYGGTGLGLAIVKQLVELMGGRIWVESETGKGSTFHFTARFEPQPLTATIEDRDSLKNVRVLVVDDSTTARRVLAELLASREAIVTEAASGEEALALIRSRQHDVCGFTLTLLDCRMPGMDGYETAQRMREERLDAGVLIPMLTADNLNVRLPMLRQFGLIHHLIKPIRRAELFSVIRNVIGTAAPAIETAAASVLADAISTAEPAPAISEGGIIEPKTNAAEGPSVATGERPLRILVADDSTDNRLLIEAFVRKAGWILDQAEDGEEAIRKFIAGKYDVVLMDIQMPVMDGYAAARRMREWESEHNARRTPIIALTASVLDEAVGKSFEAGCDTHVSKPVRRPTLLAAIREVTAASQSNPETAAELAAAIAARSSKRRDWTRREEMVKIAPRVTRVPDAPS